MANDEMTEQDVINVLRAGQIYEPGEFVRGSWRYGCQTTKFCVVVTFDMATVATVATPRRKR